MARPTMRTGAGPRAARSAPSPSTAWLEAPEELARQIFETVSDAVLVTDTDQCIVVCNPGAERLFGYAREELVGRTLAELFCDDDDGHGWFAEGERREGELVFRRKDGTTGHCQTMAAPLRSRDGELVGFIAFNRDISRQKQTERSLRASEEKHRRLVEASNDIVASVDRAGRVKLVNWEGGQAGGFDPSQIEGRHFTEFLPPGPVRERGIEAFERLMSGEQQFRYETKALRADGSLIHLFVNAAPVRDPDGRVVEVIAAAADVTEWKRAEHELRESQQRLEEAQRLARLGSWEWDIESDRVSWSEELCRIAGLEPHELEPTFQGFLDRLHPDDRAPSQGSFARALEEHRPFDCECRLIRPDGETRFVEARAEVELDDSGRPIRMRGTGQDITERKRFEAELERSRSNLEHAQRLAQIGSWEWDIEEDRISWSRELFRIWGLDPDRFDPSYEAYLERLHPEDRERVDGLVRRAMKTHEPLDFEHRIVRPDGVVRVIWGHGNVVVENGRPVRMYGTGQDITERKRVEEELRLSRELALGIGEARTVEEALELVLSRVCQRTGWILGQAWLPDAERSCLVCSPAAYSATSELERFRSFSESLTLACGQGIPGRAWETKAPVWVRDMREDRLLPRRREAKEVGIGGAMAVPVLAEDDVAAVLEFFVLGPRERDDQIAQLVSPIAAQLGLLIERNRAEQAFRDSEARARRVVDTAHEAFISIDADGRISEWNREAEFTLGWTREEAVGRTLSETIIPERYRKAHEHGLRHFVETGEGPVLNKRLELPALHKAGHEFPLELTITPVSSGNSVTFNAFLHDISERRAAEQALQRTHEELQSRTAELERSNLELEQFAHDASHDLGEPLRVMSALAERLLRRHGDALDEEARRLVASIVDGTERMGLLVSDLLEYSQAAREPLHREEIDCDVVLLETLDLLSESISEKRAKITADPLPTVQAHPRQLVQVFQNLISNALKFSADCPLRIHVGAERETAGYRFCVRDNGIGIDPPQSERIFEMFRRLHPRDMYAGTGIGLSICRRIVERHGGRIWVEQAPDGGSIFYFTLPDPAPSPDSTGPQVQFLRAPSAG
jgi:PAS domain S-box-containing protein